MADINNLNEKVAKAEEKVAKCKGTIERHQKQLHKKQDVLVKKGVDISNMETLKYVDGRGSEFYSDICDIEWKQSDIKGATRKLQDAEKILENWKSKLNLEIEKERFLEGNAPQVIKDFLEEWKELAYGWYVKRYDDYVEFCKQLNAGAKKIKYDFIKATKKDEIKTYLENYKTETEEQAIEHCLRYNRSTELNNLLKEVELDYDSMTKRKVNFAGATVLHMATIRNTEERLAWLNKDLEAEKKAKMLDLIYRINAVVGAINDATSLRITAGNLNGYIIGETGKAEVNTIGAGGYNIQCFHYRTLVKPIKKKA
jgi:hypothetical protein